MQTVNIKGIGRETAQRLQEAGFATVDDLARCELDSLMAVPGFGARRAELVREEARRLVASPSEGATPVTVAESASEPVRGAKKEQIRKAGKATSKKAKKKKKHKKGKKGKKGSGKDSKKAKANKKSKKKAKKKSKKKK